jgi:DNA-directed RNA polymerase subunit RPC12/RpoP
MEPDIKNAGFATGEETVAHSVNGDYGMPFYRCILCGHVVSLWDIKKVNGCPKCGNTRIRPSDLSFTEKIVQICKHPAVWKWKEVRIG